MGGNKCTIIAVAISFLGQHTIAVAQSCSHAAGQWDDSFAFEWNLLQDNLGPYRSIRGFVDTGYCGIWTVTGTMLGPGSVSLRAQNPNAIPPEYSCANWFRYSGRVPAPACRTESGYWYNSTFAFGFQSMHKACEQPSQEVTQTDRWYAYPQFRTAHVFRATLFGGTGPNFGGRHLIENTQPGSARDTCWFPGSSYAPILGLPPHLEGGIFRLNNTNVYYDGMGLNEAVVEYYQQHSAPCDISFGQVMSISCSNSQLAYKVNSIIYYIGENNQVIVWRDNVPASRIWPPP